MKIEIRKPQYLASKESDGEVKEETGGEKSPIFFKLLLAATYILAGLAIWFAVQRYLPHS